MSGPEVPSVTASEVAGDAYLLDVREDDEWVAGHAPDAHHLPMAQIPARSREVPTDRDVVVICRAGHRSAQVVAYLMHHGWRNVHNLDGGMYGWATARRDMVSEDGHPARVV